MLGNYACLPQRLLEPHAGVAQHGRKSSDARSAILLQIHFNGNCELASGPAASRQNNCVASRTVRVFSCCPLAPPPHV